MNAEKQIKKTQPQPAVILFDGACNLCNGWVDFVLRRDRDERFRFASLQSGAAAPFLVQYAGADSLPDSVILVDEAGMHVRSTAVLRILRELGWPWSFAIAGILIPRPLRDGLYDIIARKRYQWFGRRDSCRLPTPEEKSRFL